MTGVVVGVDESESAQRAVDRAVAMATALGEPLHLVMAVKNARSSTIRIGSDEYFLDGLAPSREVLDGIKQSAGVPDATSELGEKDPAKSICAAAKRLDASLIVVGNKHMQGVGRLLGAVARSVLHQAPCDVLVAHTSDEHNVPTLRISSAPIFANIDSDQRAKIDSLATALLIPEGRELTTQGAPGKEFGVLLDGTATVRVDDKIVAVLETGDHFGEIALLPTFESDGLRGATVTADVDLNAAIMSAAEFQTLLSDHPDIAAKLERSALGHGATRSQ